MAGDPEDATGESSSLDGLCSNSAGGFVSSTDDKAEVTIPGVVLKSWSAGIPGVCCVEIKHNLTTPAMQL